MTFNPIDGVVIALYLLGVVGLGCLFASRSSNTSGFMVAGGGVPGWAVGLSIFGTFLSSNTFIGVPGKAYGSNWNAFAFSLAMPISAWIAAKWFVPFHRNSGSISAYDHLEQRFGPWARTYGVLCFLFNQLARVGAVLFGVSYVVSALTQWPQATIIIFAGVLITLYTAIGGIEAVIWTDVAQAVILSIGALVLLAMLMFGTPEGPGQAVRVAAENNKFSLGGFALDLTRSTFWVPFFYGVFENLKNFGIDQTYVQRYHAAPDTKQASRSVWMGVLLYVPISAVFFAIGTFAFSYYQTHPEMLDQVRVHVDQKIDPGVAGPERALLVESQLADNVLPHFIVNQLPVGVVGLIVAALFAAAMSSIDSSLNSMATVTLLDLYKRIARPNCGERESMAVLYGATAAMGAAGVAVAVALIGVESVLDAYWTLSGIVAGGVLGLFLLGVVARRASRPAAATAVIIGTLVILWLSLPDLLGKMAPSVTLPDWAVNSLHVHMTIVVGTLVVFMIGLLVTWLSPAPEPAC